MKGNSAVFSLMKPNALQIADMTGGRLVMHGGGCGCGVSAVTTDSRELLPDSMFAAIRGENFDGSDYIDEVISQGTRVILTQRTPDKDSGAPVDYVVVDDTVKALGAMAERFIIKSGARTVAVTGSVGKTTTKEFISAVLSEKYKTHKSEGNKNNELGLPLSALALPAGTEYAVFECGMSGLGEIEYLSNIVKPDISVITNIGTSHMEKLGSRENIARAKLEITSGQKEDGVLIINADEPLLYNSAVVQGHKNVVTTAIYNRAADYRAVNIRHIGAGMVFDLLYNGCVATNVEISVLGTHNVTNALCAFAVGIKAGMSEEAIRRGLYAFKGIAQRQKIYEVAGITVIEDCYNASPESMRAGIDVLCSMAKKSGGRAAALLGDMRELGEYSRLMHDQLGVFAARAGVKVLFTYGPTAENIAKSAIINGIRAENVYVNLDCTDPATTGDMILGALVPGDLLLVKASRAVAAEAVIEYMKKKAPKK